MSRKNKIVVSITGITIVMLALLGITYAYYLTRIEGNTNTNSISITTADLKLSYSDGNGIVEKANFMPGDSITKTFSVENTGENKVTGYTIVLEDVVNELSRREDLKYSLYCTLDNGTSCGKSEDNLYPKTKNIVIIYSNDINSKEKHNYELIVNYIYLETIDQSDDMGSTISGKVNIYDAKDERLNPFSTGVSANDNKNLAYNIIENARLGKNGTTLTGTALSLIGNNVSGNKFNNKIIETASSMRIDSSLLDDYWTYGEDYIVDEIKGIILNGVKTCIYNDCYNDLIGKYIQSNEGFKNCSENDVIMMDDDLSTIYQIVSATTSGITLNKISIATDSIDENILATTNDNLGVSYYYRGNVIDNYVNFAGMCWRIVRISGDGSIKLILEDKNVECDSSEYTGDWSIGNGNYGYYIDSYSNKINYPIDSINSSLANKFKEFQISKLNNYLEFLVPGNWCYDNTPFLKKNGLSRIDDLSEYYSTNIDFYYGTYTRIVGSKNPTLKCLGRFVNNFGKSEEETEALLMYVGTLTGEEVVFAGAADQKENINFYLYNSFNSNWWTLSPDALIRKYEGAFAIEQNGMLTYVETDDIYNYRPAINLKSDTLISSGEGTKTNPYIVD